MKQREITQISEAQREIKYIQKLKANFIRMRDDFI